MTVEETNLKEKIKHDTVYGAMAENTYIKMVITWIKLKF